MLQHSAKKLKVVFDHQILSQEVGGISRYFRNLTNALQKQELCKVDVFALLHKSHYFSDLNHGIYLPSIGNGLFNGVFKKRRANQLIEWVNEFAMARRLARDDYDVVHVTDNEFRYLEKVKIHKPVVLTIHDLIPEVYPDYFPDIKKRLSSRKCAIERADQLICISESTKKDLVQHYDVPTSKISMVYHGSPDFLIDDRKCPVVCGMEGSYMLYVGDRKNGYKNFLPLLDALDEYMEQETEMHLLCIGSPFTQVEQLKLAKFSWVKRIIAQRVSDFELFSIYKNAFCLIYPSIYEGFGFPLLEAMKASCPIISSNTSCLPEIAGLAAMYFDPFTFDGLYRALFTVKSDSACKNNQKATLARFSWINTASQTHAVYKALIK